MQYRLLTLDIDGTLRPGGESVVPRENVEAVCAVQKAGVKVAIATGRCRMGIPPKMLGRIRPDYWICAAGAQVLDKAGTVLSTRTMTNEQMYALVDFFEDYEYMLGFNFDDGRMSMLTTSFSISGRSGWGAWCTPSTARTRTGIWKTCLFRLSGGCPMKRWRNSRNGTDTWACASSFTGMTTAAIS